MILSLSEPRTPKLDTPIILEKEVLPLKDKSNVFPQEDSQPNPMDVPTSSKIPNSKPIPPRHDVLGLLPKPSIPPLYGTVPPPSFYREKRPTSPLVHPKKPQPKHPSNKDENIPPPQSSQLPTKTRCNRSAQERRRKRHARAREVVSQTLQSPEIPSTSIAPFSPQPELELKSPKHKIHDDFDVVRVKEFVFINLDDDVNENVINDESVTSLDVDNECKYDDID